MADYPDPMFNLLSPPGETISDLLAEQGISLSEFAATINEPIETVERLIAGDLKLNVFLAEKLESSLGVDASFWMKRESIYRQRITQKGQSESEEAKKAWVSSLPIKDMLKFGWIQGLTSSSDNIFQACLDFFGEPNLSSWRSTYSDPQSIPMFRTSQTFDSKSTAVAAWLRQGEIEAAKRTCSTWDSVRFKAAMERVRSLTRSKDPASFLPELTQICADAGVAVVIVRAPSGCRASGATMFLTPDKALLMLSFRHLSDDHFWFTFFHEAGHLLLHATEDLCLEGAGEQNDQIEAEANAFAAQMLVPAEFESEMLSLPVNAPAVIRFAKRLGISPGIIVGQLQHRGIFTRRQLNHLKRRYTWVDNQS